MTHNDASSLGSAAQLRSRLSKPPGSTRDDFFSPGSISQFSREMTTTPRYPIFDPRPIGQQDSSATPNQQLRQQQPWLNRTPGPNILSTTPLCRKGNLGDDGFGGLYTPSQQGYDQIPNFIVDNPPIILPDPAPLPPPSLSSSPSPVSPLLDTIFNEPTVNIPKFETHVDPSPSPIPQTPQPPQSQLPPPPSIESNPSLLTIQEDHHLSELHHQSDDPLLLGEMPPGVEFESKTNVQSATNVAVTNSNHPILNTRQQQQRLPPPTIKKKTKGGKKRK